MATMRPSLIGLAVVLGLGMFAPASRAQDAGFSDPFFLYYGFFLPRQAALAAQPQPEDNIRNLSVQRQASVQNDRAGLYDPIGRLGMDELDPLRPFGQRTGSSRLARTASTGLPVNHVNGRGPAGYYNNHGSYYPTIRSGQGRSGRRGGGQVATYGGGLRGNAMIPGPMSGVPGGIR